MRRLLLAIANKVESGSGSFTSVRPLTGQVFGDVPGQQLLRGSTDSTETSAHSSVLLPRRSLPVVQSAASALRTSAWTSALAWAVDRLIRT
jgi:hypothetical protein